MPIPKARDLEELNAQLLAACHEDEQRRIAGRSQPVGAAMIEERAHLLPLAEQGFELAEVCFPRVDGLGCVRVRTNLYSVPVKPDKTVEVRLYPGYVEVRDEGHCIARHERSYGRQQQVLDLEHYLDVLERKPGALAGAKPLARVAGKRIVAKQLRSAVGRADLSPWKTEWHPSDDSGGKPGQTVRT